MAATPRPGGVRRLLALTLALLVVLSGCSALDPGGTDGPGSDGTITPTPAPASSVPGIEDGELTDGSALVDAHVAALSTTGFETDQEANGTQEVRGEVMPTAQRVRTISEPDGTEYQYRIHNREAGSQFDYWGNGSHQVVRVQFGGEVRTVRVLNRSANVSLLARANLLETYLGASTFTVADREVRNGTTFVTLTANSTDEPGAVAPTNATDVHNYSATVLVDEAGRVHSLDVTADYTHGDAEHSLSVEYRLVRVGVDDDVTQPDWAREKLQGGGS